MDLQDPDLQKHVDSLGLSSIRISSCSLKSKSFGAFIRMAACSYSGNYLGINETNVFPFIPDWAILLDGQDVL